MCRVILFILCLVQTGVLSAASLSDYWSYPEYYQGHQEQLPWLNELANAVRSEPVPLEGGQERPVRIGLVYPSMQSSSYWTDNERAFVTRLDQLGIRYELQARYTEPSTQLTEQLKQIRELLEWKPDYLVYTLDSVQQRMIIERLMLSHNTKLILQNITTPLKVWGERQPFLYAGFDHAEGARRLADYFSRRFPEHARYAVLFRNRGVVSQMRGTGFIQAVKASHELRASYYTDASREGGRAATLKLLAGYPDLDYIYACSTDVALGVIDGLQQLGRQDVLVNGWGGGAEELEQLRLKSMNVVLMRMNDDSAIAMAEAIKRDLAGLSVPLIYSGTFVVLDEDMPEALVHRYERLSRRVSLTVEGEGQ